MNLDAEFKRLQRVIARTAAKLTEYEDTIDALAQQRERLVRYWMAMEAARGSSTRKQRKEYEAASDALTKEDRALLGIQ